MLDFLRVTTKMPKQGMKVVYPKFRIMKSSDLMIRGGDFYAIWDEQRCVWSTDEDDALDLIDNEIQEYVNEHPELGEYGLDYTVNYIRDAESGVIDAWHKYCQKQMRDSFHMLDETLIFSNTEVDKKDYASKRLNYPLEPGNMPAYEKLISTLYSEEERRKIEWAIGSIITGDSKTIQKFLVLYGSAGTGKSTILNIIQMLFDGYYSVFDAKALGSSSNSFALEAFKSNPLVAIQHDGDLSKIEDNTRLNSLVSHELMTVNEKFKSTYSNRFKCFLFMGTNKPVKITDAKSGLIRRLIDVSPTGNKLSPSEYKKCFNQVPFELGAIAHHCMNVYLEDPGRYDDYIPVSMMGASNDFYNFIIDSYHIFKRDNGTTLKAAWEMYKLYCDETKLAYPFSQRIFKEELKNYFEEYKDRFNTDDGSRVRSYYIGFKTDIFENEKQSTESEKVTEVENSWLTFDSVSDIFDKCCAECPAQYANEEGTPKSSWSKVTTKLADLDTSKLHYVQTPENHIVVDFDIPDENGNKCLALNIEAASKWPPTYAELSKSGQGIHLHYIYTGDPKQLSRIYDDKIEIKICTGNAALRRKLTKSNSLPIATISSGLPLKGEKKVINFEGIKSEKGLRTLIKRNLKKEYHPGTKPSVDFIKKILDDAYNSGLSYDVSDMYNAVFGFAANSTNNSEYCLKLVNTMKFKSDEALAVEEYEDEFPIVFYDVEVFPNLFLVNWKFEGEDKPVARMINPTPADIEELFHFRLIGFNNRRYDNHMLYGCYMGYTNEQLFNLSMKIVNSKKGENRDYFFREAYNLSYTDVYDFASAGNKMSLKKWEIELGIHHQELGLPWDQPVPEELWPKVAKYCDNDVIATEKVFNHLKGDWTARQILADIAGLTVNDTTNTLTTRIIFGKNKTPQNEFCYRNLAEPVYELDPEVEAFLKEKTPEMMAARHGEAQSLLPYFPGYKYENGVSTYRDETIGEGGRVYAEPGVYFDVALLDIASQHPHSIIAECLFGPRFTRIFTDIVDGRIDIKHEDWEAVNYILDGKLTKYVEKVKNGQMTSKELADALKTAINSVYGLSSASFPNPFNDPRNKDNIVAKRGALFMTELKFEVQKRGFTVVHIKTDSIKVANATPEIIQFIMDFGKRYGYSFEHEATYDRICLVNKSTYIAKYSDDVSINGKHAGKWTATGAQFQVPYVFKTLFTKEPIIFEDLCEAKEAKSSIYLDMNETLPEGEHDYKFVGKVGNFCPIKPGCGGGELLREAKDSDGNIKYDAVTGTKGYRWLEAEAVKLLGKEADIDKSYYVNLANDAIDAISQYFDFDQFVSGEYYMLDNADDLPWKMECGRDSCNGCPNFYKDQFHMDCKLGYDISDVIALENLAKNA